jgi:hypothetical protein
MRYNFIELIFAVASNKITKKFNLTAVANFNYCLISSIGFDLHVSKAPALNRSEIQRLATNLKDKKFSFVLVQT